MVCATAPSTSWRPVSWLRCGMATVAPVAPPPGSTVTRARGGSSCGMATKAAAAVAAPVVAVQCQERLQGAADLYHGGSTGCVFLAQVGGPGCNSVQVRGERAWPVAAFAQCAIKQGPHLILTQGGNLRMAAHIPRHHLCPRCPRALLQVLPGPARRREAVPDCIAQFGWHLVLRQVPSKLSMAAVLLCVLRLP